MIDFVSTREGADPQTRRAAHFLAALVAQRLRDACTPIDPEEAARQRNFNAVARAAVEYLFDADSEFVLHIELLGGGAAPFRAALLGDTPLPLKGDFTEPMRRALQARHQWWVEARRVFPVQP